MCVDCVSAHAYVFEKDKGDIDSLSQFFIQPFDSEYSMFHAEHPPCLRCIQTFT